MHLDLAIALDDLVVRAQVARLEHADRTRPIHPHRDGLVLGGLAAAAEEANDLAEDPGNGAAATLFAFGRRAYLFPEAHRSMTFLLTAAQARRLGFRIVVGDEELDVMLGRLVGRHPPGFSELCAWLARRLVARRVEEDERLPRAV